MNLEELVAQAADVHRQIAVMDSASALKLNPKAFTEAAKRMAGASPEEAKRVAAAVGREENGELRAAWRRLYSRLQEPGSTARSEKYRGSLERPPTRWLGCRPPNRVSNSLSFRP